MTTSYSINSIPISTRNYVNMIANPLSFHSNGQKPDGSVSNTTMLTDYYSANPFYGPELNSGSAYVYGILFFVNIGSNDLTLDTIYINNGSTASTAFYNLYSLCFCLLDYNNEVITIEVPSPDDEKYEKTLDTKDKNKKRKNVDSDDDDYDDISIKHHSKEVHKKSHATITMSQQEYGKFCSQMGNKIKKHIKATAGVKIMTNGTANYDQITGGTNNSGSSVDSALAQSFSFNGIGVQFTPTIEVATNSSTPYIMRYYGAQVSAGTLYAGIQDARNILQILKEGADYAEYNNAEGLTMRFDILQDGIVKPYDQNALSSLDSSGLSTERLMLPCIMLQFSDFYIIGTSSTTAFPFNVNARWHLESILSTPTPIQGSKPSFDPFWLIHSKKLLWGKPTIVSGHSFFDIAKTVVTKVAKNKQVRKAATNLLKNNAATAKYYNQLAVIADMMKQPKKRINNIMTKEAMDSNNNRISKNSNNVRQNPNRQPRKGGDFASVYNANKNGNRSKK